VGSGAGATSAFAADVAGAGATSAVADAVAGAAVADVMAGVLAEKDVALADDCADAAPVSVDNTSAATQTWLTLFMPTSRL